MSREIDEKIVAMYFNNDQFERNARQSMKTLDELKSNLDFEGVGESFQEVQKMTSKGLNLKDTTKQAGLFSRALTGIGKVAKTTFNAATFPLQALSSGFKTLEGYVGKVLGFNLASKLVSTGETVIRAFTIDPVRSGWSEYELKMDSIKTILTGTAASFRKEMGDAYTEESHLKAVKAALEELNLYADKTVYSFSDMTSNIGKFTNNGIALNDAVMSMKGIANAAALAGQGTQQASMAMYNLSQAIGMGKLTIMDWRSIENANMGTVQLKQTFIDIAAAMGKLRKEGDKYYTTTGKKMEVTAENFRETLQAGWADTDVITAVLKVFSGDFKAVDLVALGVSQDVAEQMEKMGQEAMEAATQVRTFTKMWDALKESAQSGWATTFEYIVGDMNEATEMWTQMSNRFDKWISSAADKRNDLFRGWRGKAMFSDVEKYLQNISVEWSRYANEDWWRDGGLYGLAGSILRDLEQNGGDIEAVIKNLQGTYKLSAKDAQLVMQAVNELMNSGTLDYLGKDGRSILLEGVNNLLDGIGNIASLFGSVKTSLFGEMTPQKLQAMTQSFTNFTAKFKEWTLTIGQSSFVKNLQTGFKGVLDLLRPVWNSIKKIGDVILEIAKPVGEFLGNTFAGIGEFFSSISQSGVWQRIEGFYDTVKDLVKVKVGGWFKTAGENVRGFFKALGGKDQTWFDERGMSGIGNFLINFGQKVSGAFNGVVGWSGWSVIGDALSSIWSGAVSVWNAVSNWSGWGEIGAFFSDIFGWVASKATKIYNTVTGAFKKGENGEESPVMSFLRTTYETVSNFWNKTIIPWEGWGEIGAFFSDIFGWVSSKATKVYNDVTGAFKKGENGEPSAISQWLTEAGNSISTAWASVEEKIRPIASKIFKFLTDAFNYIVELAIPSANAEEADAGAIGESVASAGEAATAVVEALPDLTPEQAEEADQKLTFFERLLKSLGDFVTKVGDWEGWSDIGNTFGTVFTALGDLVNELAKAAKLDQVAGLINRAFDVILDALDILVQIGEWAVANPAWAAAIVGGLSILNQALTMMTAARLSEIGSIDSVGAQIMELGIAVGIISAAIKVLGEMRIEDLGQGIAAVAVIAAAIGLLIPQLKKLTDSLTELSNSKANTHPVERVFNNLIKWAGIVITVRSIMELMPALIGALDGVDVEPGQLLETFESIALLFGVIVAASVIIDKIGAKPGGMISGMLGIAVNILIVAGVIYVIIEALGALSQALEDGIGGTSYAMQGLKTFLQGIGEAFGALSGGFEGAKVGAMAEASTDGVRRASDAAADIDVTSLQKLQDAMAIIKTVGDNMPRNPDLWQQWFGGGITFDEFPGAMESIANGVKNFASVASEMTDEKLAAADRFAEFLRKLLVVGNLTQLLNDLSDGFSGLNLLSFLDVISNPGKAGYEDQFEDTVDQMSSFATEFNAAIEEAALEINVTPLVDAICNGIQSDESRIKLRTALTSIGAAFGDEDMQLPGITVEGDSSGGLNFLSQLSSLFSGSGLTSLIGGKGGEGGLAGMINGALEGFNAEEITNKLGLNSIINFDDMTTEMSTMVTSMQTALEQSGESLSVPAEMAWSDGNVPTWWSGGADMPVTGTVTIDATSLTTITSGLTNVQTAIEIQGSAVVSAVSALGTQIDALGTGISNIGTSISNIRLVLDTGAIAGAVDARLGEKAALLTRQ